MNPKTNEIVFALIDELIDAFEAKAFHVGMDEVFLLSSEHAPSTKDLDPADVFAKVVNDLHGHIVKQRGLTMLMWADRLIDGDEFNMGEWEASKVGTAPAVDKIPKDIILCPWHYEMREKYESLPMFMEKGFRILPASWKNTDATLALIRYARANQTEDRLVGHIFTTWSQRRDDWSEFEPLVKGLALLQQPSAESRNAPSVIDSSSAPVRPTCCDRLREIRDGSDHGGRRYRQAFRPFFEDQLADARTAWCRSECSRESN